MVATPKKTSRAPLSGGNHGALSSNRTSHGKRRDQSLRNHHQQTKRTEQRQESIWLEQMPGIENENGYNDKPLQEYARERSTFPENEAFSTPRTISHGRAPPSTNSILKENRPGFRPSSARSCLASANAKSPPSNLTDTEAQHSAATTLMQRHVRGFMVRRRYQMTIYQNVMHQPEFHIKIRIAFALKIVEKRPCWSDIKKAVYFMVFQTQISEQARECFCRVGAFDIMFRLISNRSACNRSEPHGMIITGVLLTFTKVVHYQECVRFLVSANGVSLLLDHLQMYNQRAYEFRLIDALLSKCGASISKSSSFITEAGPVDFEGAFYQAIESPMSDRFVSASPHRKRGTDSSALSLPSLPPPDLPQKASHGQTKAAYKKGASGTEFDKGGEPGHAARPYRFPAGVRNETPPPMQPDATKCTAHRQNDEAIESSRPHYNSTRSAYREHPKTQLPPSEQAASVSLHQEREKYTQSRRQLQDTDRIQVLCLNTAQGRTNDGSINGCAVIAAMVAAAHLNSAPNISVDRIESIIDHECCPVLQTIRRELGYDGNAPITPSEAQDYLVHSNLLHQEKFIGVSGGNILDPKHYRALGCMLAEPNSKKVSATLFYRGHVISIVKCVDLEDNKIWFDWVDSLPGSAGHATRTRCMDVEALRIQLQWYALSKLHDCDDVPWDAPWDDYSGENDPRVFQGFVWSDMD